MFIILNGPLGVGKSTLAEALTETIDHCVRLSGDHLIAVNPPPADELEYLHSTIALLIRHHQWFGYHHFVIEHVWRSGAELDDLRRQLIALDPHADFRSFLLMLPEAENIQRIERRQRARVIDEREFERRTVAEERQLLTGDAGLGEPFDVSAPLQELVAAMLRRLDLSGRP